MTNEIEQGLHEKLCAFVLGEASDEVRAEVEKALEASAELRAERERLEKTIGLVKEAMAGSESLSASADEILAEARRPRQRTWYTRPAFRIAAGLAAIAIVGAIAYRAREERRARLNAEVAKLERTPAENGRLFGVQAKTDSGAGELTEKKGYDDESSPPSVAGAPSAPAIRAAGEVQPAAGPSVTVDSLVRLDEMHKERNEEGTAAGQTPAARKLEQKLAAAQTSAATPVPADSASIGVGSSAHEVPYPIVKHGKGAYRGPSDTAPSAAASTASNAPAGSAGGGAPSSGDYAGPMSGSDDFFLGKGRQKDLAVAGDGRKGDEALKLRELGYVVDDRDEEVLGSDLSALDQLRRLDAPDREKWIEQECHRILTSCRRRPNERPRDMFFRFYGDNPFELAILEPQSTFSVDVDTASYALARRYINEGHIPEKAQVRTEEFVNYFKADVPAPTQGTFAIHTDLAPSRYSPDKARWMLRVVVRGREVAKEQRKPLNLTFVLDVSGSMREQNRLEMVKHAVRLLVGELGAGDNIAIVTFSDDAKLVLPMTSVRNRSAIETALEPLEPTNSTNSEAGLKLGYATALANINPEAQNRVVFLSDGVANVGETDPAKLSETVKPIREKGIYLNTIGVGMNNHNDVLLEQLADKGDGVCSYIDSPDEARKVIVDGFSGAFQTIARDVKVQVEFDPAQVDRYRLLGYENRAIANKDFRNDKIDAGEVGAGHQVTALYEIERASGSSEKPLATVRLRWKAPRNVNAPAANEEATEIAQPVLASGQTSFEGAGTGYRRAVIVAQFAEFLRRSVHARGDSLDDLIADAAKLEKETSDPEVGELLVLLQKSKKLILDALPPCDDLCRTIDAVRRNEILRSEREMLAKGDDRKLAEDLEKQNADLEAQIRDLLRRKLEQRVK